MCDSYRRSPTEVMLVILGVSRNELRYGLTIVILTSSGFRLTVAVNQVPSLLMFRNGELLDRRLGMQTHDENSPMACVCAAVK